MTASLTEKKVLVLSDNNGLSRAIEVTLRGPMDVVRVESSLLPHTTPITADNFDLIVVAMCSSNNDPVVALSNLSLVGQTRDVPILIVSDRSDHVVSGKQPIYHLDFPFDIDAFCTKVTEILHKSPPPTLNSSHSKSDNAYKRRPVSIEYDRQAEYWVG